MRIGSLCSGAGALDLAVMNTFGADVAWHCEVDPAASQVLEHRFPEVPNLGDLTKIDWDGVADMPRGAKRQEERGQAMYDRYCQGLSLSEVGAEFGVSRQSVFVMFKRRELDMRPRPAPAPTVEFNGELYALDTSNGYYRKTRGDRAKLHRDMWRHHIGPIPEGWDIHHRDHDKTHNVMENLLCIAKDEHARLHAAESKGVMPETTPAIDVLTAGWPRSVPALVGGRPQERR